MEQFESRIVAIIAGVMWAVAVTMMTAVTLAGGSLILAGWALMTALWACVWTGWGLILRERHRLETLAAIFLRDDSGDGLKSV